MSDVTNFVPEPTIDEMLAWLNQYDDEYDDDKRANAIRAILEHQRLLEAPVERVQLEGIRAFIQRVHKRADEILEKNNTQELFSEHFMQAFLDELRATEKEWSAGSVSNAKK